MISFKEIDGILTEPIYSSDEMDRIWVFIDQQREFVELAKKFCLAVGDHALSCNIKLPNPTKARVCDCGYGDLRENIWLLNGGGGE